MILQPVSWKERDAPYTVDVYGRTHEGDIARVRLTGFKPYFYIELHQLPALKKIRTKNGFEPKYSVEQQEKFSTIGFEKKVQVLKVSFDTLWGYSLCKKLDGYETNFPPYLKLIHDMNLNPASPFEFPVKEKKSGTYDYYDVHYSTIKPATAKIPLYILSYDLEVYSKTGFPVASEPTSEIMQIGISTRWSDNLLEPVERMVLVVGEVEGYISCKNERDLLMKFQDLIKVEEPDIITGYNTFGFDDGYLYDRFQKYHLEPDFGREETAISQ
jgi:DNA polymerase elongation subunit (family B)